MRRREAVELVGESMKVRGKALPRGLNRDAAGSNLLLPLPSSLLSPSLPPFSQSHFMTWPPDHIRSQHVAYVKTLVAIATDVQVANHVYRMDFRRVNCQSMVHDHAIEYISSGIFRSAAV